MNNALASAAAARKRGPSQPVMMTSVVISAIWASWAITSGQPSVSRARNSPPQLWRDIGPLAPGAGADGAVLILGSTRVDFD